MIINDRSVSEIKVAMWVFCKWNNDVFHLPDLLQLSNVDVPPSASILSHAFWSFIADLMRSYLPSRKSPVRSGNVAKSEVPVIPRSRNHFVILS